MNNHPTVKDVYSILGGIETDIDWLQRTVGELKLDFKEHLKRDRQLWLWAIPTAFMLLNLIVTVFWKG